MAMASSSKWMLLVTIISYVLAMGEVAVPVEGLSKHYYSSSCPKLFPTVRAGVKKALKKEVLMGPSLLRLHFHDCFVNGCDGSILLNDTPTFTGEKTGVRNIHSLRGFQVVDDIKAAVEKVCPGVVSCADILAIIARDSTFLLGGPYWKVRLGRRDSTTANITTANSDLPNASSNISTLISNFANQGLSIKDLVALSGAHTIGRAKCANFRDRIYNDTNIDSNFAAKLKKICPRVGNDTSLSSLDTQTPKHFDNSYYENLLKQKGLLHSDQELTAASSTLSRVNKYVKRPSRFFKDFAKSMVKMGNISPLTGSEGEIRINCGKVNS